MEESRDWNKLPPELRYLAASAEVYGSLQFDDPVYDFLQHRMTPQEQVELKALSQKYECDGDAIDQWLDQYPMTIHAEARLVYFTRYLVGTGCDLGLL